MSDGTVQTAGWREALAGRTVLIALVIGLAVRLLLIPFTSSPFDVSAGWVAVIEEIYAGDTLYDADLYKYPPVWGYILAVLSGIADLLGMSSFGEPLTDIYLERELTFGYCYITTPGFNTLVKAPALIFDVLTAFAAYRLVRDVSSDRRKAEIGFAMWFLCPVVIMSSAVLCMFDSIMVFFMIEALILFRGRRYGACGAVLALSVLTKAFSAVLLPIMVVCLLSDRGVSVGGRVRNLAAAAVGFAAVVLLMYWPLLLSGEFSDSLWFLSSRGSSYSESGFSVTSLSFNNIFFYLPAIAAVVLAACIAMAAARTDRDRTFLVLAIVSLSVVFCFPFVSYTPTYGIVMLPAILILYALNGRVAWIPWALTSFFVLHGIAHYWCTAFYPLAAWWGGLDIAGLSEFMGNGHVYNGILYCMSLAGFSLMLIVAIEYVVPWIRARRGDARYGTQDSRCGAGRGRRVRDRLPGGAGHRLRAQSVPLRRLGREDGGLRGRLRGYELLAGVHRRDADLAEPGRGIVLRRVVRRQVSYGERPRCRAGLHRPSAAQLLQQPFGAEDDRDGRARTDRLLMRRIGRAALHNRDPSGRGLHGVVRRPPVRMAGLRRRHVLAERQDRAQLCGVRGLVHGPGARSGPPVLRRRRRGQPLGRGRVHEEHRGRQPDRHRRHLLRRDDQRPRLLQAAFGASRPGLQRRDLFRRRVRAVPRRKRDDRGLRRACEARGRPDIGDGLGGAGGGGRALVRHGAGGQREALRELVVLPVVRALVPRVLLFRGDEHRLGQVHPSPIGRPGPAATMPIYRC